MNLLNYFLPTRTSDSNENEVESASAHISGWQNTSETVRLGSTQTGHLDWNTKDCPNLLLMGDAGTGKSVLHRAIFYHCLTHNDDWAFYAIDFFRVDTAPHKKYTQTLGGAANDIQTSLQLLEDIDLQIKERYSLLSQKQVQENLDLSEYSMKSIMLVIDTFYPTLSDVFDYTKPYHSDYESIVRIRELFARIIELGSKVGVHIVWTTIASPVPQLDSQFVKHFNAVITTSRINNESSQQFFGSDRAAFIPEYWMSNFSRGKGLAKFGDLVEDFQGYLIDDTCAQAWVKENGRRAEPELWKALNSQ